MCVIPLTITPSYVCIYTRVLHNKIIMNTSRFTSYKYANKCLFLKYQNSLSENKDNLT